MEEKQANTVEAGQEQPIPAPVIAFKNVNIAHRKLRVLTGITFTKAGTFLISYRNDDNDLGKWNWASQASGTISYGWDDDDMGNSLENGAAAVNFDGSKCRFTLNAALGTYKVQIIYTLIP